VSHREQYDDLKQRVHELITLAYEGEHAYALRDVAVPLAIDLVGELGAVLLELELVRG
jgi:hypothetical protein